MNDVILDACTVEVHQILYPGLGMRLLQYMHTYTSMIGMFIFGSLVAKYWLLWVHLKSHRIYFPTASC